MSEIESMAAHFLPFLRAGGRVSLDDFLDMEPDEQTALVVAGDLYMERILASLALYVAHPERAAEVLDGGKGRRSGLLKRAVAEVKAEIAEGGL